MSAVEATLAARPARARLGALRAGILEIVLAYVGVALILPLAALAGEALAIGPRALGEAMVTPAALHALQMSLALVVIAVVVNAVVGTLGAIMIVRHRFPGRAYLDAIFDLPLAISPVMIGLGIILLVGRDGVAAPLLDALGFKLVFSFSGLVIATLFVTLPYVVREVVYVLEELGTDEEEAAITLGASELAVFFRVTLPNVWGALRHGLVMTAARALGEFGAVLVLGGSLAGHTQTATTFIHDAIEERDLAAAFGMSGLLALLSAALLLILERLERRPGHDRPPHAAIAAERPR